MNDVDPDDDLALIYIRARVNGKWGSYSLRELLTQQHGGEIGRWFMERMLHRVGLEELAIVTEANVELMIGLLESIGQDLVRLTPSPPDPPDV